MVYNTKKMYDLALAKALDYGPRAVNMNGTVTAVYALKKSELRVLFTEQGYSPRRRTWINNVRDWDMFLALVPIEIESDSDMFDPAVIFTAISERAHLALSIFAQDQNLPHFPTEREIQKCNGIEGVKA